MTDLCEMKSKEITEKIMGAALEVHLAQALYYLKAYKLEVALIINFGSKSLNFKRLVL